MPETMARVRNTVLRFIERRPAGQSFPVSPVLAIDASGASGSGRVRMRTSHVTAYGLVDTSRSSTAGAVKEVNGEGTSVVPEVPVPGYSKWSQSWHVRPIVSDDTTRAQGVWT